MNKIKLIVHERFIGEKNPIRYKGYYFDKETGVYYLNSSYYDPEIGRFISVDALVNTATGILGNNMFAYCNNNPVALCDSEGTRPIQSTSVAGESSYNRSI